MKKFVVFMLVALMLFVALPGFAVQTEPTIIDPGPLNGDSDILVGEIDFSPFGGISAVCSDDRIRLELTNEGGVFDWNSAPAQYDVDGMFIRTTAVSSYAQGTFGIFNIDSVDITYDIYEEDFEHFTGFDVDLLNQDNMSFSPDADALVNSNSSFHASWDFSELETSRFVFNEIIATISDDVDAFGVGVIKVDETPRYTVAVLAVERYAVGAPAAMIAAADDDDDDSGASILGIMTIDSLDSELTFEYGEEDKDRNLFVLIQNWSKDELVFDAGSGTKEHLLADDFIGVEGLDTPVAIFPLVVNTANLIGSGMSCAIMPSEPMDGPFYTIAGLNGKFNISFGNKGTLGIILDEEGKSSGGGCSVGFLAPSALLLLLPLMFMRKR